MGEVSNSKKNKKTKNNNKLTITDQKQQQNKTNQNNNKIKQIDKKSTRTTNQQQLINNHKRTQQQQPATKSKLVTLVSSKISKKRFVATHNFLFLQNNHKKQIESKRRQTSKNKMRLKQVRLDKGFWKKEAQTQNKQATTQNQ